MNIWYRIRQIKNFRVVPLTLYSVHCTVYIVVWVYCTFYGVHCRYIVHCTVYIELSTDQDLILSFVLSSSRRILIILSFKFPLFWATCRSNNMFNALRKESLRLSCILALFLLIMKFNTLLYLTFGISEIVHVLYCIVNCIVHDNWDVIRQILYMYYYPIYYKS